MIENSVDSEQKDMLEFLIEVIEIYSYLFLKLGDVERKYDLSLGIFQKKSSQEVLKMFSPSLPPEKLGYFFKLLLIFAQMGGNLKNFVNLEPNKKIEIGKTLKAAIDEYKEKK